MPELRITSIDDPRIASYRELKDRRLAEARGRFIAEGRHIVQRLLVSGYPVESVLVARRRKDAIAAHVGADIPLYVVEDAMIHDVVGFRFHAGIVACGRRRPWPSLADLLGSRRESQPLSIVICPEIHNAENLGALVRISAAFGADALLLGPRCCDPFWRRAVRVSMGTVFHLPMRRCDDLGHDLAALQRDWGVALWAAVAHGPARALAQTCRPHRMGLLLGSESQGLEPAHVAMADQRVTIPMHLGTDSLNVAVAAGILLYHFTRA